MIKYDSEICHYYERRINIEIAAGEFSADHALISSLKNSYVTPAGKKFMGVPETIPLTMYDVERRAIVLPRIRFIYLLSMLEGLFKDYICERENIRIEQVKSHIANETSTWSRISNNDSTSFYHIPYAIYVFKEKYQIEISSNVHPATLEMGILRNCIVHHDGKIANQYFENGLTNIGAFLAVCRSNHREEHNSPSVSTYKRFKASRKNNLNIFLDFCTLFR